MTPAGVTREITGTPDDDDEMCCEKSWPQRHNTQRKSDDEAQSFIDVPNTTEKGT
jgi:hypothetical protein